MGQKFTTRRVKTLIVDLPKILNADADPKKRETLRALLIEEENKLARNRERLEAAKRRADEGRGRLKQPRKNKRKTEKRNEALRVFELTRSCSRMSMLGFTTSILMP